jgi:hypothetical protein
MISAIELEKYDVEVKLSASVGYGYVYQTITDNTSIHNDEKVDL